MPRPTRSSVVEAGRPVHVVIRGNNRRRLFSYPTCYAFFLRALARALRKHGCTLHVIALMTNHVHLLLTAPSVDALSRCMHSVLQVYAQYRNRCRAASGKLFEERFKSFSIRDEAHLWRVALYIDLNPFAAGMIAHPGDRSWTSYQLHAGDPARSSIPAELWTPGAHWLALGSTDAERRSAFAEIVAGHLGDPRGLIDDPEQLAAIVAAEKASEPFLVRPERPDRSCAG